MRNVVIGALAILSLTMISCKKHPGCMDENAENYNWEAEEDDGSCSYRGSAVFYHDEETSNNLLAVGITTVKLYIDGSFWDSMASNIYFDFVPECTHPDAMNMENFGIGNSPSKSFDYLIKDQDDHLIVGGTFKISGNTCKRIEYEF